MSNEISVNDIMDELQRQFPKELTIAVQAVQIHKMQEQLGASDDVAELDDQTD